MIECPILYKHVPIGEHVCLGNLIQFDVLEFDAFLRMDWLTTHGTNINFENLKVTLKDPKGLEA